MKEDKEKLINEFIKKLSKGDEGFLLVCTRKDDRTYRSVGFKNGDISIQDCHQALTDALESGTKPDIASPTLTAVGALKEEDIKYL